MTTTRRFCWVLASFACAVSLSVFSEPPAEERIGIPPGDADILVWDQYRFHESLRSELSAEVDAWIVNRRADTLIFADCGEAFEGALVLAARPDSAVYLFPCAILSPTVSLAPGDTLHQRVVINHSDGRGRFYPSFSEDFFATPVMLGFSARTTSATRSEELFLYSSAFTLTER